MSTYEKRVVAFLDILGFKNWIDKTENKKDFDIVNDAINYISNVREEHYHGFLSQFGTIGKEVSVFSDSIIISYAQSERGGFFYVLMDLVYICVKLSSMGIFVRGGVTYGKLIHKKQVCFGPAMVEAYNIEQNCAKYPRIIIDEKAIKHGIRTPGYANTPEQEIEYITPLIKKDKKADMFYLDFLSQDQEMDNPDDYYIILIKIKTHVINNLNETRANRKVFKKYRWFAKYYNDTIRKLYKRKYYQKMDLLIPDKMTKYS